MSCSVLDGLAGFDPYDALRGERIPGWVRRSRWLRQALIQLRKRVPLNLSPVLGIEPYIMAKTVGCHLIAAARDSSRGVRGAAQDSAELSRFLLEDDEIARLDSGAWGYEFDVQTRWAYYAAQTPNVIASYFVARGFLEYGLVFDQRAAIDHANRTAEYVTESLRSPEGYYCYTPDSPRLIHNANLLAAGLLAVTGRMESSPDRLAMALTAAHISCAEQDEDGLWPYGEGARLAWIDNFHTAYALDGLLLVWLATDDYVVERALRSGAQAWQSRFFGLDGTPAYYVDGRGPQDIHSAATAVDVGMRLASAGIVPPDVFVRVHEWTNRRMVESDGRTIYRIHRWGVDRRHFPRWGDAHWRLAESSTALCSAGVAPPLERALCESSGRA